jgi:hypothetical protein
VNAQRPGGKTLKARLRQAEFEAVRTRHPQAYLRPAAFPAWAAALLLGCGLAPAARADCSAERPPATRMSMQVETRSYPLAHVLLVPMAWLGGGGKATPAVMRLDLLDREAAPREIFLSVVLTWTPEASIAERVFRLAAGTELTGASGAIPRITRPEVNRWVVGNEPEQLVYADRFADATARVEFGTPRDGVVPGRVRFCVEPGQPVPLIGPTHTQELVVEGSFAALLRE